MFGWGNGRHTSSQTANHEDEDYEKSSTGKCEAFPAEVSYQECSHNANDKAPRIEDDILLMLASLYYPLKGWEGRETHNFQLRRRIRNTRIS